MHCSHSRRQRKSDPCKMWRYNVGSRVGVGDGGGVACSLMSRETILQTKDLSSGRHPAPLKSPWENHWISTEKRFSLRGFNIHYYGWSILFNQEETWQAWLHLLGDPVHDFGDKHAYNILAWNYERHANMNCEGNRCKSWNWVVLSF